MLTSTLNLFPKEVVEKLASSPNAAASSFKVLSAEGAESMRLATSASTYALIDCWLAAAVALFELILSSSKRVNVDAIVTAPPLSDIDIDAPAVNASVSPLARVLPPAVTVLGAVK